MAGDGGGGHDGGERTGRLVVVVLRSRGRAARARGAGVGDGAGAHAMIARWRGARRAAVLRAAAAVLLALVLAGVSRTSAPGPRAASCVILAVDVSASVRHAGLDAAARLLPALGRALGPHDVVGAIAFAGEARVAAPPASAAPTAQALAAAAERVGDRSRRERSLGARSAWPRRSVPTDSSRRCCCSATATRRGATRSRKRPSATRPMPVFPVMLDATELPLAVIRRVLAPATVADRVPVPLEAVVESHAPAAGRGSAGDGRRRRRPAAGSGHAASGPDRRRAAVSRARRRATRARRRAALPAGWSTAARRGPRLARRRRRAARGRRRHALQLRRRRGARGARHARRRGDARGPGIAARPARGR